MPLTRPPVLPVWADTGDKTQPSDAELSVGWPVTSIPPSRQRFNWFQNFLANGIRYFARRGLSDYAATETYEIGDRCIGDDGKTYKSLVAANINFAPSTNPTKWERWGFSLAEMYAFLLSNHGGNCPVTGPASAPSAGAPWTRDTSVTPYFEQWEWFPNVWRVVANHYSTPSGVQTGSVALPTGNYVLLKSYTIPRAGTIVASVQAQLSCGGTSTILQSSIARNGLAVASQNLAAASTNDKNETTTAILDVAAGDIVSARGYSAYAAGSMSCDFQYAYQK